VREKPELEGGRWAAPFWFLGRICGETLNSLTIKTGGFEKFNEAKSGFGGALGRFVG